MGSHNLRGQLFERIVEILPEYVPYKALNPRDAVFGPDNYKLGTAKIGEAIFIRKGIKAADSGYFLTYSSNKNPFEKLLEGSNTGGCQYLSLKVDKRLVSLISIHGLWQQSKKDTPERLEQSRKILEFIENKKMPTVLVGDFNLNPKTKSIAMLGKDLRNLISEYGIKKTRSRFYANMEKYKDYIADYAFVSPEISVKDFRILNNEASDHLPLFLNFDYNDNIQ